MNAGVIRYPTWGSETKARRAELESEFHRLRGDLGYRGELIRRIEADMMSTDDHKDPRARRMREILNELAQLGG